MKGRSSTRPGLLFPKGPLFDEAGGSSMKGRSSTRPGALPWRAALRRGRRLFHRNVGSAGPLV